MSNIPIASPNMRKSAGFSSQFSPKGINLRELPQFLDVKYATEINNFLIDAAGRLIKRGGLELIFSVAGTAPITMLRKFTDDIYMFAYGTTLAAYKFSTNTVSTVHTFSGSGDADGVAVGNYFFVCNGTARIGYVNTSLVHALVTDTNAPSATVLYAAQGRLFAGAGKTVYWSAVDSGTGVPFNGASDWTAGTSLANANKAEYENAGNVRAFATLGQQVVAFYDNGKSGFRISAITVGSTINQTTELDFQRIDFGAFRGAVYTQKGIFYANEQGMWRMVSGGNTNQPYSEREDDITIIFGKDFFNNVDFSNADLVHDTKNNLILCTCAQDSTTNNLILWYNIDTGAMGKITGWNISRFLVDGASIYGASANSTKVYELYAGNDGDDGAPIYAVYTIEANIGDLTSVKSLEELYGQFKLSPSSVVSIYLDIYDRTGTYVEAKKTLTITANDAGNAIGFGSAPWGSAEWGDAGDNDGNGLVNTFVQTKQCRINEFTRLRIRMVVFDKLPMEANWLSARIVPKYAARLNNITVS